MPARKNRSGARRRPADVRRLAGKVAGRLRRSTNQPKAQRRVGQPATAPANKGSKGSKPGKRKGRPLRSAYATFFQLIERDGDVSAAATSTVREYLRARRVRHARTFAQVLQNEPDQLGEIGTICMAMVMARSDMHRRAWELFRSVPIDHVLRLAPAEYLRLGFIIDPDVAQSAFDAVLSGELTANADALGWLDLACATFVTGTEKQSRYALARARAGFDELDDAAARRARRAARRLASWFEGGSGAAEPLGDGELSFGVLAYRQPDLGATSRNLGNYLESLACLSHLTRRSDLALTGEARLTAVAEQLSDRNPVPPTKRRSTTTARLTVIDRDASRWSAAPKGTWLVYAGLLPQRMYRVRADLPLDPRVRPIFISVHVNSVEQLTPDALAYLRRYAPIGCRDWATTLLLLAAGVPAFFAGAVTATLGAIAAAEPAERTGRLFVDVAPEGGGKRIPQELAAVRKGSPAKNLRAALSRFDGYRAANGVTSSRLQSYLAARAAGTDASFAPRNPAERRFDGLDPMSTAEFAAMQQRITDRLTAVLDAIVAGQDETEVYALWRRLCAADVAEAEAERAKVPPMADTKFDVAAACATIRGNAVTVERNAPAPEGDEINVELSLDANYKHQLEVVLDSVVFHASRPVRAFVLSRDLGPPDHDRLAALFPAVSFVWLPTDAVDYGPISGLLGYTTIATMDRLLLPDLLPEISRIIHHDLDALCLTDIAELFDTDLAGTPVGGVGSPLPSLSSGYNAFLRQAEQFQRRPELGRELLRRTHGRHNFDFHILNAGIMLLDLDVMRADEFGRNFVPYVERFGMNDQAVINVYAGANRVDTAPGWNWRPWLEQLDDPKIAHWAGKYKPWSRLWVLGKPLWQDAEARVRERYELAGLS